MEPSRTREAREETKLAALAPAHVQTLYCQKLDEGFAPKTVKYLHTTLHRALRQAVRWGLLPRNAAAEADPPRVCTPEMRPLSPIQARTLLDAARGDRLEALYVLAVTTGMRQGELLGLGWEDVDLESGVVRVSRPSRPRRAAHASLSPRPEAAAAPSGSPLGPWTP